MCERRGIERRLYEASGEQKVAGPPRHEWYMRPAHAPPTRRVAATRRMSHEDCDRTLPAAGPRVIHSCLESENSTCAVTIALHKSRGAPEVIDTGDEVRRETPTAVPSACTPVHFLTCAHFLLPRYYQTSLQQRIDACLDRAVSYSSHPP
jgi:hypothetical protein